MEVRRRREKKECEQLVIDGKQFFASQMDPVYILIFYFFDVSLKKSLEPLPCLFFRIILHVLVDHERKFLRFFFFLHVIV